MGNRLLEGVCVCCGGPVIETNDWHCCSQCVRVIREKALKAVKNKGQSKRMILPGIKRR